MISIGQLFISVITSLAIALAVYAEDSPPQPLEEPAGELTLAEALALALERNPGLSPYAWDIRAAEARTIQAGLRPNPELGLELEDVRLGNSDSSDQRSQSVGISPADGFGIGISRNSESMQSSVFGDTQITLTLSQLVELGGKRAKRVDAARKGREVSAWDYEVARADVLAQTARSFYAVLAAQEHLRLAEHLLTLAGEAHQTTQTLVDAGKVSAIEASRSQVELSTVSIERDSVTRQLNGARIELAGQWGNDAPVFTAAVGILPEAFALPSADTLKAAIAKSPYIARWIAELDRRDAVVALERANGKPDLTVMFGVRSAGTSGVSERGWEASTTDGLSLTRGDSGASREARVVLGVSVPLPLFNRNQGAVQEAEHLSAKAIDERRATEAAISNALAAGYERASGFYTASKTLKETVIPTAQEAFDAVQIGYRAGKFGLLDVLLAQRALFDAQRQLADSHASFQQAIVEIERFTGMPVGPEQQTPAIEAAKVEQ